MLKAEQIYKTIAPHIIGNEAVKQLLFLHLFLNPHEEKFNTLCIGDVGSSKTDLAEELSQLHPNSAFITRHTTSAGIFGAATKYGLEGGLIRDVDGGLIVIDELDKIDSIVRKGILQLIDRYAVTITKYGWSIQINAKVNCIATANPVAGNWLTERPSIHEIQSLGSTMINRFHLIIPFVSLKAKDYDKLTDSFIERENKEAKKERIETIRKYVEKTQGIKNIEIPRDIIESAVGYMKCTKEKHASKLPLISPRQIEGLIALLKASARSEIRSEVNEKDFKDVTKLYDNVIKAWL